MDNKPLHKQYNDIENELLSKLYQELEPMMFSLARRFPMTGQDADDLVQEMRIKVWKIISQGKFKYNSHTDADKHLKSYFYKVCYRHLIDLKRAKYGVKFTESGRILNQPSDTLDYTVRYEEWDGFIRPLEIIPCMGCEKDLDIFHEGTAICDDCLERLTGDPVVNID